MVVEMEKTSKFERKKSKKMKNKNRAENKKKTSFLWFTVHDVCSIAIHRNLPEAFALRLIIIAA